MLNFRNSGFYTGSFSTEHIVPNTPYLHKGDLIAATDHYCSPNNFDADACSSFARKLGERVGVLLPNEVLMQQQERQQRVSPSPTEAMTLSTVAAASMAVASKKGSGSGAGADATAGRPVKK